MKKLSTLLLSILSIVALTSCDKDMGPVANTADPGAPSITSPSSGASFTLNRDQADDTLMTIEWSQPDFGFTSAPTYTVEMGLAGSNFEDAMQLGTVQKTSFGVVTGNLNRMLLAAGLAGGEAQSLELRVTASISDSVNKAVSEPVSLTVTPFQTDFPPIYMIGEGVGGWSIDAAVIVPSTEPNVYSTLARFTSGGAFRFFGQQDWGPDSYNYPYFSDGTIDELLINAQDGDSNFQFTGETGWYRVTVNLDSRTVDLEAASEPVMYMTGSAVGGWDTPGTGASVKMTYIQDGVYEATTEFAEGAFRFFAQADWSPTSYNYPYFADGTVDELLADAQDGDNNFQFTGQAGSYHVTLNLNDLTVEMEASE